ncbi:MAG: hypothetical protein AAF447_24900, partial [Myxococcota bacterium]
GEVLGQPSPRERRPAATVDDTLRLAGPVTLAQDGAQVFVGERDVTRISIFDFDAVDAGGSRELRVGPELTGSPTSFAATRTRLFRTTLTLGTREPGRLLQLEGLSRLREDAR